MNRVQPTQKMRYLQQQKEVEYDVNDVIESDIFPTTNARESSTIKKTVNIEVGGNFYG